MAQSDDKSRNASFREASRLRATLGSEPSSGYAFHDKAIVERLRPGREGAAPQIASHAPRERAFASTLVGGATLQDMIGEQAAASLASALAQTDPKLRSSMSGASWPSVPDELVDTADEPTAIKTRPSERPPAEKRGSVAPNALAGGAIWQAMPSVTESVAATAPEPEPQPVEQSAVRQSLSPSSAQARPRSVPPAPRAVPTVPPAPRSVPPVPPSVRPMSPLAVTRPGRPAPAHHRPSVAELEAEQAHAYGDPRVMRVEKLVESSAWEQLSEQLAAEQNLSPALRLLKIVSQRETQKTEDKGASAELTRQAISTVAALLQLPEGSPTALVIAKRLLRKNRVWTRAEPASTGLSAALLAGGLAVGAGIGWLVTAVLL